MTSPAQTDRGLALLLRKARSAVFLVRHHGRKAALRARNLSIKRARHTWSRSRRLANRARERTRNLKTTTFNLTRFVWRRVTASHKPVIRRWRRAERDGETLMKLVAERRVLRRIHNTARGGQPLIVGPWLSEVGFETLYWVPFLRWVRQRFDLEPRNVIAISRGGVGGWYEGIADTYVELFDFIEPAEFARRNETRQQATATHKQVELSDLDRDVIAYARRQTGASDARVFHPSLMYGLFREYWLGYRPISFVQDHLVQRSWKPAPSYELSSLPKEYIAVKLYTALSLPPTQPNREALRTILFQLAETRHIVLLDTGIAFDDHDDYVFAGHPRVHTMRDLMTPTNNLGVQTEVIARSQGFVSTCGGLAWISPLMGVPTIALFSDAQLLRAHLFYARTVYLNSDAAPFQTVDVGGLQMLMQESMLPR